MRAYALFSASNEANFRTSAYEALTSYVTHAAVDTIPIVQNITIAILGRMEQLLNLQVCYTSYVAVVGADHPL